MLQAAYLAAAQRLAHYKDESSLSAFVWLRMVLMQTMTDKYYGCAGFGGAGERRGGDVIGMGNAGIAAFGGIRGRTVDSVVSLTNVAETTDPQFPATSSACTYNV